MLEQFPDALNLVFRFGLGIFSTVEKTVHGIGYECKTEGTTHSWALTSVILECCFRCITLDTGSKMWRR